MYFMQIKALRDCKIITTSCQPWTCILLKEKTMFFPQNYIKFYFDYINFPVLWHFRDDSHCLPEVFKRKRCWEQYMLLILFLIAISFAKVLPLDAATIVLLPSFAPAAPLDPSSQQRDWMAKLLDPGQHVFTSLFDAEYKAGAGCNYSCDTRVGTKGSREKVRYALFAIQKLTWCWWLELVDPLRSVNVTNASSPGREV